jgi:hypothetical protein
MKLSSLPWVFVPGMGQIRGGAPGVGVVIFALFILALNGYLLGALLTADSSPRVLGFLALALWLVSMIDGIRRLARNRA